MQQDDYTCSSPPPLFHTHVTLARSVPARPVPSRHVLYIAADFSSFNVKLTQFIFPVGKQRWGFCAAASVFYIGDDLLHLLRMGDKFISRILYFVLI
jgi:hypothetical protein